MPFAIQYGFRPGLSGIVLITLLLLSGCSTFDFVNAITFSRGSSLESNVSFGPEKRHKLDIYRPLNPAQRPAVIVFFYGGSWNSGEKDQYEFVARKLALAGHYVVIPNYRVFPEVIFPGFVEDAALAVKYVSDLELGISGTPLPIFLKGHSAGAHIAMMVALDQKYLARLSGPQPEIAGVIGLSGPYDFLPLSPGFLPQVFPDTSNLDQTQPINFVDANDPPVFLGHGLADPVVWAHNARNLAKRYAQTGVPYRLKLYPGVNHRDTLKPFVRFLEGKSNIPTDVLQFIEDFNPGVDEADR